MANFLKIQKKGRVGKGSASVTSFAPPEVIIKGKKELN